MVSAAKQFYDTLTENDIKFTHHAIEDEGKDHIEIRYNGDSMPTITIHFVFNSDSEDASIRIFNVAKNIPDDKMGDMLIAVNALNEKYRFAKFCLDADDSSVQLEMDAIFRTHDVGVICFEYLQRAVSICDGAYSILMKALWA